MHTLFKGVRRRRSKAQSDRRPVLITLTSPSAQYAPNPGSTHKKMISCLVIFAVAVGLYLISHFSHHLSAIQLPHLIDNVVILDAEITKQIVFIALFSLLTPEIESQQTDINVFYHIYMEKSKVDKTWSIIDEQMDVLNEFASKHSSINLHLQYVSIGVPVMLNSTKYKNIYNIERTEHLSVGDEPNTLQHLHNFCLANTNETVVYIHAKGSFHATKENDILRRYLMYGLFSKNGCLNNADLPSDCSVCASRFNVIPYHYFYGNMWMAHCSYIQHLISPSKFEQAMNDKVSSLMDLLNIDYGNWEFGLERSAAEHWVASHPFLKPCDVYKGQHLNNRKNLPKKLTANKFNVSLAPRSMLLSFRAFEAWRNVSTSRANQLYQYQALYGSHPPKSSWFWKYHADKNAVIKNSKKQIVYPDFLDLLVQY